jgi:hypothetical protein
MKVMIRTLFIVLIISSVGQLFGQTAEYLVIGHPSDFVIYNKYQQKLKQTELESFADYSPFRIIDPNEILSDQITFASRCSLNNEIYFVLKDEDNSYLTENSESYIQSFSNCETIQDTIKILKSDRISIKNRPVRSRESEELYSAQESELWIRIFRHESVYYLKRAEDPAVYGWAVLPGDESWKLYIPPTIKSTVIPDRISTRIEIRIASVNQSYRQYFSYFNRKYHMNKPVPEWTLENSDTSIRGIISNPGLLGNLNSSTTSLLQELENIILGTGLTIDRTSEGFIIQEKLVQ